MPIRKGDKLLLRRDGIELAVEAAEDERGDRVRVRFNPKTLFVCRVADLRPADETAEQARLDTERLPGVGDAPDGSHGGAG